jgi:hypothetical protein
VLRPSKLVAIDLAPGPVPELTQFIATRGLEESVRCYHGVNQADRNRLREIIDTEFSDQPIDLVIDDGGHQYGETRSSFETLFPRLRPGGRFIIEDWGWAHFPTDLWQQEGGWWRDRPGLTNLVIEIMMISASAPDVVAETLVDHNVAEITRGPRELPDVIDLPSLYLNRGRRFRPLL